MSKTGPEGLFQTDTLPKALIKKFTREDIWEPTYRNASEERQSEMKGMDRPVEVQANEFIQDNNITVLSVNVICEYSGGFHTPVSSKPVLYLMYIQN